MMCDGIIKKAGRAKNVFNISTYFHDGLNSMLIASLSYYNHYDSDICVISDSHAAHI